MSLRDQFQSLQQQSSSFRLDIFGATAVMMQASGDPESGDADFQCYYSPVSETEQLSVFGIKSDFDLVLRVPKTETNFVPEIGRNVKIFGVAPDGSDLICRLVKPRVHPTGVEHVFECKSLW